MSTQAAVSGNVTKNNGGTIKKGGSANTTTGPITQVRTLMDDAKRTQYGSKIVLSSGSTGSSGNLGTFNAITNFAHEMVAGRYIMKKNTSYVNGSSNTLLTSCAADVGIRRSIPFKTSTRSLGVNSWDYVSGQITKGSTAGDESRFGQHGGTIGDHAASPTDTIPGELQYKTGAKLPVEDDYKPRTG